MGGLLLTLEGGAKGEGGKGGAVAYPCRGCCGVVSWRGGGVGEGAPGSLRACFCRSLRGAGGSVGNGREALGMELELVKEKEAITYSTSTRTGAGSRRSGRSR